MIHMLLSVHAYSGKYLECALSLLMSFLLYLARTGVQSHHSITILHTLLYFIHCYTSE